MHSGPGNRERSGLFLADLAVQIALHTARSALAGMASLQCGNLPFDAQATVFAHGKFVNEALGQNQQRRWLNSFNEGQAYVD
jgi:hypothetical protein